MKISRDNTRALGVGETVLPSDYYVDPLDDAILPVEQPEVGKIITDDELLEYRRPLSADPYEAMIAELGLEHSISRDFFKVLCECAKLFDQKQTAYGMGNVQWLGEYGINLRVGEKTLRIKNLLDQRFNPQTETIEDSWKDMVNLSAIGLLVHRNLWK